MNPPIDRRRLARRAPRHDEPVARVRLRAGGELAVVDLSPAGALVEGETRLLPGRHADVHVMTLDGRMLVRSRVVRAFVHTMSADRIVYRGALAFEQFVQTGAAIAGGGEAGHADGQQLPEAMRA